MFNFIHLFYQGVLDSLDLNESYQRYCSGKNILSDKLKQVVRHSLLSSATCVGILLLIDSLSWGLSWVLPSWIFFPFKVLVYSENMLKQTVYIQRIASIAASIEIEVLDNKDYLIYELESSTQTLKFYEQINLVIKALLFSIILLLQTSLLDIIVLLLPNFFLLRLIVAILSQLLYSVYISVGLYSLKIPYQDHLPYYFHKNITFLAGLSFLASIVLLNLLVFPYQGAGLALILPFLQLQVMHKDPCKDNNQSNINNESERQSYKIHLMQYHKDPNYKIKTQNMISWFRIPKMLRPYLLKTIKPTIKFAQTIISPFTNFNGQ